MDSNTVTCTYFSKPGKENTQRVVEIAKARAEELGIRSVVVATTTGYTGVLAAKAFEGYNLIAVTHSTGFKAPNYQELSEESRVAIQAHGGKVLTAQHGFGGVGRAVRKKLGTYELEELVAYTLRMFGEGMKVVCEISLMAADAGLIPSGQPVIAIAGTGRGADTAVVLRAVNAQAFFDMRIMEVLCKPGFYGTDQ